MQIETWAAFTAASLILLIIPGPTILLVIGRAIAHGRKSVVPLATGVFLGDFSAMTISLTGLGALLSASAALFHVLKWIGAGYLLYLGIKQWRLHPGNSEQPTISPEPGKELFRSSFLVTLLNPKSIAFFIAFFPHFINPSEPVFFQFFILGATFLSFAVLNVIGYALFAGHVGDTVKNPKVMRWLNRCGGSALIGAGILTAGMEKS